MVAFALGGVALVGVPPSGASLAKELLLQAAAETQQWWWAAVVQIGGIFTSSYLILVLAHALAPANKQVAPQLPLRRVQEVAALVLALCSLLLGLVPWETYLSVPLHASPNSFSLATLTKLLWPILGGAVWGGRTAPTPLGKSLVTVLDLVRRYALAFSKMIEPVDGVFQRWAAATVSLLIVAILFGAAMLAN